MPDSHVTFDDTRWLDVGGGVTMAPLRVEAGGAGTE